MKVNDVLLRRLFGPWPWWLAVGVAVALGDLYARQAMPTGMLPAIVKSTWFAISTLSPFLVITALARIASE